MKKLFNFKFLGITITVFVIIWLLTFIPVNLGFFNPMKNALYDFDLNDIVFSKLTPEKSADTNVVIVNIGYLNRPEIAKLITIIKSYKPKVVGLDILFRENKEALGDSLLEEAIKLDGNTVIVDKLSGYNESKQSFDTITTAISRFSNYSVSGYANLPSKDGSNLTTIRLFRPESNYKDSSVDAFATEVVKLYDKNSYNYLIKRNNSFETINYRGNADKFYYVDGTNPDNLSGLDFIKNKIVLLGFLGNYPAKNLFEDIFYTPLNENYAGKTYPDMYGVVIHANIISMILNRNYINELPAWIGFLLAMVVCYLNIVMLNFIKHTKVDWLSLISLTTKTLEFVLLLFIDLEIFINFDLEISITLMLASIVLISDGEAIYDIITENIKKLFRKA